MIASEWPRGNASLPCTSHHIHVYGVDFVIRKIARFVPCDVKEGKRE
jgi:hypothetical protein